MLSFCLKLLREKDSDYVVLVSLYVLYFMIFATSRVLTHPNHAYSKKYTNMQNCIKKTLLYSNNAFNNVDIKTFSQKRAQVDIVVQYVHIF